MKIPLPGFVRDAGEKFVVKRIAKELSMGAVGKLIVDHKKSIAGGVVFGLTWAFEQKCGVIYGIDVLLLLQKVLPSLICDTVQHVGLMLATALVVLGISDPQEWLTNWMGLAKKKAIVVPVTEQAKS